MTLCLGTSGITKKTMSTITFRRGDVVLVRFVFADEQGSKRRPAVILSSEHYHSGRAEAIVAAVTSNIGRSLPGDHLLGDWDGAGLPKPSVATGIIRTIKRSMIERRLGALTKTDLTAIEKALRPVLGL